MQADGLETRAAEAESGPTADTGADDGIADDADAVPRESPNDVTEKRWSKQSRVSSDGVGATAINEPAPQLNRRFFLGLNRASARRRARQRREARRRRNEDPEGGHSEEQMTEENDTEQQDAGNLRRTSERRRSSILRMIPNAILSSYNQDLPISATLVEEEEETSQGEIVEAKRIGFFEGHWQLLLLACLVLSGVAIALAMLLGSVTTPTVQFTDQPTNAPTYDPRPTLEIILSNGYLRCGMDTKETYRFQLCRAVAAVVFGDPAEKYRFVKLSSTDRFVKLQNGHVDLLLFSDTHTMEREINERTTGKGFTFSDPYSFSGLVYLGNETYVKCAEQQIRYEQCQFLKICVGIDSTHKEILNQVFPSDFMVDVSFEEMPAFLINGTCNALVTDSPDELVDDIAREANGTVGGISYVGDKYLAMEPLAAVTRQNDREYSDIVNWAINSMKYAEAKNITKDDSMCTPYEKKKPSALDLDFMRAVHW